VSEIYLTKTLNGFVPADEQAKQAVKRWKIGETLRCDVKKPRDYRNQQR
jgi:hypothetical protein